KNICSRLSKGYPLDLWVIALTPRRVCLITWNFDVYELPAHSLTIDAHSHQQTISLPLSDAVPLKEKWPALYGKSHFDSYRYLVDYAFILSDEKADYLLIGQYGNDPANGFVYQLDTQK